MWQAASSEDGIKMTQKQAETFLEEEAQSLNSRYRPLDAIQSPFGLSSTAEDSCLRAIRIRCQQFESDRIASAALQEQQERELSPEIERERQIERPAPAKPLEHVLHQDVVQFVQTGVLKADSDAFRPAFHTLRDTSAADHLDVSRFPKDLVVSHDFARTVHFGKKQRSDAYHRPVQWILTTKAEMGTVKHMVIISPFEAQELIPIMDTSKAYLHLYAPRQTLTYRSLDELTLYTIPPLPPAWIPPPTSVLQLNLFSGQLYFHLYSEYRQTCEFLGLAWGPIEEDERLEADGFIIKRSHSGQQRFSKSPIPFFNLFIANIRRNCQGISKTHLGRMFGGELLEEAEFPPADTAA